MVKLLQVLMNGEKEVMLASRFNANLEVFFNTFRLS